MPGKLQLTILDPEGAVFDGEVAQVALPGELSPFTVFPGHAPMISALGCGELRWSGGEKGSCRIVSGFVKIQGDKVSAMVER